MKNNQKPSIQAAKTGSPRLNFLKISTLSLSLLTATAAVIFSLKQLEATTSSSLASNKNGATDAPTKPDAKKYRRLIAAIEKKRNELSAEYTRSDRAGKQVVIEKSRTYLEKQMPDLMRCWIGTPWDFNGTSQTPGEGKIACGYFVSVILRDAGFKVQRISMAQQPSQRIITSMIKDTEKKVIRYNKKYSTFIEDFKKEKDGIYIIGLDTHVGFLTNFNDEVHFLHSGANGVIDELPAAASDIEVSKYRVIGNITDEDHVIEKWLKGQAFATNKG